MAPPAMRAIRGRLAALGLTQYDLAAALRIGRSVLNAILNGRQPAPEGFEARATAALDRLERVELAAAEARTTAIEEMGGAECNAAGGRSGGGGERHEERDCRRRAGGAGAGHRAARREARRHGVAGGGRPGHGRRSCGSTWRTNGWRGSIRRCGSSVWRSCSTAGSWRSATQWPPASVRSHDPDYMIDDPFYKRLLGNERVIRELIETFIAPTRPPEWLEALDFDTLERGPTENVTDADRRRTDDMIWSVGQAAGDGAECRGPPAGRTPVLGRPRHGAALSRLHQPPVPGPVSGRPPAAVAER